jgi:hypothetical protein
MDPSDVHPDLLGKALSHSGQRLAQLGSLLTSWAMVEARRAERRSAAQAARSEQELNALREQERAAWQLARAGWAPALDRRWLAAADLMQTARAWSAAAAHAGTDPGAAATLARCEERLRALHPYAMARYDRLRAEGAGLFDAMQDALPLFARAPRARPGDPGRERPVLARGATPAARGYKLAAGNPGFRTIRSGRTPALARTAVPPNLVRGTRCGWRQSASRGRPGMPFGLPPACREAGRVSAPSRPVPSSGQAVPRNPCLANQVEPGA